ncbi:MAG TPA: GNAT family N-acetyltransferase [Polyangiaceae bacterium]|nr:GNAT family N-acetyltransferase [Polyangiaceae bacterium]
MERIETQETLFTPPRRPRLERSLRLLRPAAFQMRVLELPDAMREARLRASWQRLFADCAHPNAFHSSPAWSEYLHARGAAVRVAVVRSGSGTIAGILPLVFHSHSLDYSVGERRVARSRFRVAGVLGSVPLIPERAVEPPALLAGVLEAIPECDAVFTESLPAESPYARLGDAAAGLLPYAPVPARTDHIVRLEGSFATYMRKRSPKLRVNVERALRMLSGTGPVQLKCYREPADVDRLFTDASRVRHRSWQFETLGALKKDGLQSSHDALAELSRRELLRGYVLYAGGTPCAFVVGYQFHGVFFYSVVGYDANFARHSPGIALLYLMLEDLFAHDRPRMVSFGRGDDDYKRRFATTEREVGTHLFFRPTLRNRMRVRNHRLFVQARDLVAHGPRIAGLLPAAERLSS